MEAGPRGRGRPQPMRWRPVFSPLALVSGLVLGLGSAVLEQQFALRVLTRGALVQSIIIALAAALVVPSLARAVGVRRYNRALRDAGLA